MIKEKEALSDHTTFRMGGIARTMYVPESFEELKSVLEEHPGAAEHVIGGGSNLLINDKTEFEEVLSLKQCCTDWVDKGEGRFYIGASVRLQKMIRLINEAGYGGIEYLYSVPGLVGGAIFMNAGRGKKHNKAISDYIISVDVLENGERKTYAKEACDFAYRSSIFQKKPVCIILGAEFVFSSMTEEESSGAIKERLELCKKVQDMSEPNFGTVFCKSNARLLSLAVKLYPGKKDGCHFSKKTGNWMLHGKNGSFKEAMKLIRFVKMIHRLFGKQCVPEVRIWEQ